MKMEQVFLLDLQEYQMLLDIKKKMVKKKRINLIFILLIFVMACMHIQAQD